MEHSREQDGKNPCPHRARGTHTKSQCLLEVDKVSEVGVRGLRVMRDKGRSEKAVRESLTEEVTIHQRPVLAGGDSLEAGVRAVSRSSEGGDTGQAWPHGHGGFGSEGDGDPREGFEQRRNMVRFTF